MLAAGIVISMLLAVGAINSQAHAPPTESAPAAALRSPAPLHGLAAPPGAPGPGGDPTRRTLVLYNSSGASAELSHSDAIQAANLASRGGAWVMHPVEQYSPGELRNYQALIYVARYSPDPLPPGFLSDITRGRVPVLWMGDNVEQLFTAQPAATSSYGWRPGGPDTIDVPLVDYGGQRLLRRTGLSEVVNQVELKPGSPAKTLGLAVHPDGSSYPWAVTANNLTYIGEVPFSYVDTKDRYLAAADIIERMVSPATPDRKRALIRIEDVGPNTDPGQIRAIADLLSSRGVPFSLATYPYYRDPLGAAHNGTPASFRLVDTPALVDALQYAQQRGATIIMHGYSHQYESARNPYDATSGSDFEFYAAHVDAENAVQLDGPVPADSRDWAANRLAIGRAEFVRVGMPDPGIFEFPHYTASPASYVAVQDAFGVRYDQGTYFAGLCPAGACTTENVPGPEGLFQQYFPYPVRDVYGSIVIPENIGNISEAFNTNAARTPQDIIDAARAMTVVHDGVASGFFHPFLPLNELQTIVEGIQAQGYHFVSPADILADRAP